MGYPAMSADVFQNANISILACQLFMMVLSFCAVIYSIKQSKPRQATQAAVAAGRL